MAASLDELLKSVSRSFYLSLRVLPSDIRPTMGMGYLLCRAADSIADTPAVPEAERLGLLSELQAAFETFPLPPSRANALAEKVAAPAAAERSAEGILLRRFGDAVTALFSLSKTDQALVQRVVAGVLKGMRMDLEVFGGPGEGVKALGREADLERYLDWIGGDPGRFWMDVCSAHRPQLKTVLDRMRPDGIRFGTGLQLINILRDLPADLKNGRCYIPTETLSAAGLSPDDLLRDEHEERFLPIYHGLIDSAIERLEAGYRYVEAMPRRVPGLRAAVWWPLVIGLRTLGKLREARAILGTEGRVKVSRGEVYWLLATSAVTLPFNRLLRGDFDDLAAAASSSSGLTPRN